MAAQKKILSTTISIRFSEEDLERAAILARRLNLSRGKLIRLALREWAANQAEAS